MIRQADSRHNQIAACGRLCVSVCVDNYSEDEGYECFEWLWTTSTNTTWLPSLGALRWARWSCHCACGDDDGKDETNDTLMRIHYHHHHGSNCPVYAFIALMFTNMAIVICNVILLPPLQLLLHLLRSQINYERWATKGALWTKQQVDMLYYLLAS